MQQPQYNQPGVSTQLHSIYSRGEQLNNLTQSSADAQRGTQFNLRDTDASQSTWQWRKPADQAIEDQSAIVYVPDNDDSFAPPANLDHLQRVDRPEEQQSLDGAYLGEIYKSPIDLYRSRPEADEVTTSDSSSPATTSNTSQTTTPPHDTKTNGSHGFVSRELPSRMFYEHTDSEEVQPQLTEAGRPIIRLKSQSELQIQRLKQSLGNAAKAQETPAVTQQEPAPARLLLPDFASFQGSPQLHSPGQPIDQWSPIPAKPIEQAADSGTGSKDWITYSPQATEEVAPPSFESPVFPPSARVTSVSSATQSEFVERSDAAVFKPVSSVRAVDQSPVPKFNFEAHQSWAPRDETSHVTSTIQPGPVNHDPLPAEIGWLSPWWILVGLIPFALYVALRGSEEETLEDYDLSESPRLSPEMLRHPGYSKSDPVYGEDDLVMAVPILRSTRGTSFPTNVEVDQNSSPNFRQRKKRKRS